MSNDTIQLPKCPECGGDVVVEDGRLECTDCSLLGVNGDSERTAKLWRLWGAAKDLLDASLWASESMEDSGEELPDWMISMRAAIAKAKGE